MKQTEKIILASSSPYRRALLERLGLEFEIEAPAIDESPLSGESGSQLVLRLACKKAENIAIRHTNGLIIGSDQVACMDQHILGKPGNRENAIRQLQGMCGQDITFYTGLCLYAAASRHYTSVVIPFQVSFRDYSLEEIQRYLDIEEPYDCAGSFKSEKLGISLVRKMYGDDPTALMGLPLIRLSGMLREAGLRLP